VIIIFSYCDRFACIVTSTDVNGHIMYKAM
jgi:hypothetical protein